jgi:hypothetical protein
LPFGTLGPVAPSSLTKIDVKPWDEISFFGLGLATTTLDTYDGVFGTKLSCTIRSALNTIETNKIT